jgi:tRNA A-37 threonylcarbamoyl transferase component Bud32
MRVERENIQLLLGEALDLPAAERVLYLDRVCGTQGPVRDALNRLLIEHEMARGILDRPLFVPLPAPKEDIWTGRVLNSRYQLDRFLARGGMSTVYVASDLQLAGKRVIVKFLPTWALQSAELKKQYRLEMEALARIQHRGVVGVLDTGETNDGLPFLVMEFVDGVTLRAEMERGAMPPDRAAGLIRQVARAVDAAHSKGVLHRDVKPENIMLEAPGTAEECVRLIDFGLARLDEADAGTAARTTQFAGTTPYMAPEQLRGKAGAASDIYGIAVVAYEMLAGQRPFTGASPIELYEQQRSGPALRPLLERGVPEHAARLIAKQLAFRPQERGASALEGGEALADALLDPRRSLWSRRRTIASLTSASVAAAGGGLAWWRHPRPLRPAERVVELSGGSEPLEHGFRSRGDIDNRAIMNAEGTHLTAIRLITKDQGGYYHPLDASQAATANRQGWKMMFEAAIEEGGAGATVDFADALAVYTVNLIANPGGPDMVRLLTGFRPELHGIDIVLDGPAGAPHRYMLALPPASHFAELWVDGVKRHTGYGGHTEYRYRRGPEIGVARYRSARGIGVFWSFRFQIG